MSKSIPSPSIRLQAFLPLSYASGPGRRAVLWLQPCPPAPHPDVSPAAFPLPATNAAPEAQTLPVDMVWQRLLAICDTIDGVTIAGGEPFEQASALATLLARIRAETSLSVLLQTGYTWMDTGRLARTRHTRPVLAALDVLVTQPVEGTHPWGHACYTFRNHVFHLLSSRYTRKDIQAIPPAEVIVTEDGGVFSLGFEPVGLTALTETTEKEEQ